MSNPELSICIPTYNRASILDETLQHLAEIDNIRLEVIVSDNASDDLTAEVARKYENKFCRFSYHRQAENLGYHLNIQSALNLATSEFSYFLSDDDRIIPETFRKILLFFQNNPGVVAVYGNHCEFIPSTGEEGEVILNIKSERIYSFNERGAMIEDFGGLWCPVMRTETSQRHCFQDNTTFGFWRQAEMFIQHGSIAMIPDLIYKHAQTIPRMEHQLIEPWYHDLYRSDAELFVAGLNIDHSLPEMSDHILRLINGRTSQAYLQGFRFSVQQKKYLLQRHYLLRAFCYGQVPKSDMKAWEEHSILHCVLERIETLLKGLPDVRKIILEASSVADYILRLKEQARFSALPDMELCPVDKFLERGIAEGEMLLALEFSTLQARKERKRGYEFSLADIIGALRVTSGHLDIKAI